MTDSEVRLTPATDPDDGTRDVAAVIALLRANDLPTRDVRAKAGSMYLADADGEFVGVGGVERHGANGLLRSVVVREPKRGRGYGTAICDALEARARANGVGTLYLLTTREPARSFFEELGYEAAERTAVPAAIRETDEFTTLCPSSATCLKKALPSEGSPATDFDATPP